MIISHTIQFRSRKWRINVKNTCFLERSNRGHQCLLNNATCNRSEWFSWCPVCDFWCLMWTRYFFVSLLSSLDFQCYDHFVSYVTTTFVSHNVCDHNFLLVCRFNLQFSQNYINIDTDEFQHWFWKYGKICDRSTDHIYSVFISQWLYKSLWNKNTIYDQSNGRIFYHIFITYTNTFFFLFYIVLYTIVKHIQPVYTWIYTHQFEH